MARDSQDTDSEGPRGRTGRPETPSSSANSSLSRRPTPRVHFEEPDMCNPLASPRSDVTVTAVPVPVPSKSTNPRVGVPSSLAEGSQFVLPPPSHDRRNAFAQRKAKLAAQAAASSQASSSSQPPPRPSSSHPSRSVTRASSIPPVPPFPVSILKNRPGNISIAQVKPRSSSAPPSPPKMDDSSNVPGGNNKPLPVSPSSKFEPHTPSPRTPSFKKDGMHRPSFSPMERVSGASPSGVSPTTSHRSSLTIKDLPEAVRSLQSRYETDQKRLSKKLDDMNKLEQKLEGFITLTHDYVKDLTDALFKDMTELSDEFSQAKLDAKEAKEQVRNLKEEIHEMRTEINGLTSSLNDLGAKVDMCLSGIWDNTAEPFVAYQRRKNKEIDEDIQDIGDQTNEQKAQITFMRQMIIRTQIALRVLQQQHGLTVADDVERILPPTPLPALPVLDPISHTGTLRTLPLPSPGSEAIATSSATATSTATPAPTPALPTSSTTSTAKPAPKLAAATSAPQTAKATPPASATGSSTVTPPGSSTVKQSSIPRRTKKNGSKKSASSTSPTQRPAPTPSSEAPVSAPPVPTLPPGIRVPGGPGNIPFGDIHPLFRPQFREANAQGIPAIPAIRAPATEEATKVETGKEPRK
ncbi:uncharacterized protein N7479_011204 [Penicillium vulpinum]|uniref:Uncharacterized protein n=1 Tax=Penicillium vulpinum TaxID=29845 RepID=A0A1V6RS44_9EURO|nr:uncharacterized protein N7479_011204 [Penicillium vulpinum]KAJ5952791.1 hypothetical protein N7479_011204 [Penicillium vulpinum]OQE04446.1 hypothetical protein PENVUL_c033G08196 [Penicillium vulpinum]